MQRSCSWHRRRRRAGALAAVAMAISAVAALATDRQGHAACNPAGLHMAVGVVMDLDDAGAVAATQDVRGGSPGAVPAPTPGAPPRPAAPWDERLARLAPAHPEEYFALAEEVADVAAGREGAEGQSERRLAARLFGLAGALDPGGFARPAALALAELADDPAEAARLRTAAMLLDRRGGAALGPGDLRGEVVDPEAALALSEALSHYRRGLGPKVTKLLALPGVSALLELHGGAIDGGSARLREDAKVYRGQSRPALKEAAVARMLQLEAGLLAGRERPWSADRLLTKDQPLAEVDPSRLDELFGIDPRQSVWRGGQWVAP